MVTQSGLGGTWANVGLQTPHSRWPSGASTTAGPERRTLDLSCEGPDPDLSRSTVPDHGSSNLTGIEYRAKTTGSYGPWASVGGTVTNSGGTFELSGFANGTERTVQVQTVNDIGTSDPSNEESATPEAPPAITMVAITSTPATDKTYAIGEDIVVTFTFDKNIEFSGTTGSDPYFSLRVGTGETKEVDCTIGTAPTKDLVCTYPVAGGDEDSDGVSVPSGTITPSNMKRIVGPMGQDAVLTHSGLAADSDHKVDGVRPELTGARASADKTKIILTFSEAIGSVDLTKITFMSGMSIATTTSATTTGSEVEITLTNALTAMDTSVTVELDADAVEDAVGNGNAELAATQVKLVEEIWSATLTVGDLGLGDRGCNSFQPGIADALKCSTSTTLTDNTFSYGGRNYEIEIILLETGFLNFQVDENLTAAEIRDLTLNVGSDSFPFEDASTTSFSVRWTNPGLTWNEDDMVALSIDADPPPMLVTAQVETATTLALIFDQGLDSSSLPAATAFAVTVNGSSNSVSSAAFNTAGDGVVLTVGTAMSAWDTVVKSPTYQAVRQSAQGRRRK